MAVINGSQAADVLNGTTQDDSMSGVGGNDTLYGGDGFDTLNGGTGVDYMEGGDGSDYYFVDNPADIIVDTGTGWYNSDEVFSTIAWTLSDGLEHLTLDGTANITGTGNSLHNSIFGNSGNNVLKGLDGRDTLSGWYGDDRLNGGDGDDHLYGQWGADTLNGGSGNDLLYGFGAGDDYIADVLNGGSGNDTLIGDGGADTLNGGNGNDVYEGVSIEDVLIENAGGGIDEINTSNTSWTLANNFENLGLRINDSVTSSLIEATGNKLANRIDVYCGTQKPVEVSVYGFGGNDTLIGRDVDLLDGGSGNDVLEISGSGGTILGGIGNDSLRVQYGENATLTGGAGEDVFLFHTDLDAPVSTITDFNGNQDALQFTYSMLWIGEIGPVSAERFHAGTSATTAEQRLIYDDVSGHLYYDEDGNGVASQQLILNINVTKGVFDHQDISILSTWTPA